MAQMPRISMGKAAGDVTMQVIVTNVSWWMFRVRLGLLIIRFGVWLAGFCFRMENRGDKDG